MRKAIWCMLMTAGALLPGLATAQEGRGRFREGSRGAEMYAQRHTREADTGNGVEVQAQPRAPQQPPQAQPRPSFGNRGDGNGWGRGSVARPEGGGRNGDGRNGGDGGRRPDGDRGFQPTPQAAPQVRFQSPSQPQPRAGGRGDDRADWRGAQRPDGGRADWRGNRDGVPGVAVHRGGNAAGAWQGDRRGYSNGPSGWQRSGADWRDDARDGRRFDDRSAWNRGWRNDNRYDWNRYRVGNRSAYHLPRYDAPYGWDGGYRRFSIGVTLSDILFAQDYWIDDPYEYRLPPAYGPYRWVRYYNDALLVDVRYGEVVDIVYDIFW